MNRAALLIASVISFACGSAFAGPGQILHLAELNTLQIQALDRARTVVLIPGGILEEHGPYLPSFTDGYRNEATVAGLAATVAARPGWTALVFPTIPLGVGGANEIGGHYSFAGTYAVRSSTLRAIFADIGAELGEQGFKWIFIVHLHGSPNHNKALDQAGDFFRDSYGGRMVHLYGLMPVVSSQPEQYRPDPKEEKDNGHDLHAGRTETSSILHLRPDLVSGGFRNAIPHPGFLFEELAGIAKKPGWPGYCGAPSQASAAEGAARLRVRTDAAAAMMWRIIDGADERKIPRFADVLMKSEAVADTVNRAKEAETSRKDRFEAWLRANDHD